MSLSVVPWLMVGLFVLLLALFVTRRAKDPVTYLAAFFFYFSFGPVINNLIGNPIYGGTVFREIPAATVLFGLALLGMLIVGIVTAPRLFEPDRDYGGGRHYPLLNGLLIVLIVITVALLILVVPTAPASGKHQQIALVGAQVHYPYLLIQFCAASLYFIAQRTVLTRVLYWSNFAGYVVYCLAMFERDFIFVAASIMVHRLIVGRSRIRGLHLVLAGAMVYSAAFLFELRSPGTGVSLGSVLNQGSLLFVDTFVLWLVPDAIPYMNGWTYLNSLGSLLPDFIRQTDFYLLDWFVDLYAPGSPSGYGFSLESEAYLNFGYAAVPVVFGLLAGVQRLLMNRLDRHPVFAYLSVFYFGWLMYSFRGDSLQLMNGLLAAVVLFGAVYLGSRPADRLEMPAPITVRPPDRQLRGATQ